MPPSDDKSRIEELKRSLYERGAPDVRSRRKLRISQPTDDVKPAWERKDEPVDDTDLNQEYEDHSMSFFTKLLIGSAIFAVLAVGVGAYLFFNGANLVSGDNIDIRISGPVSIPGGEPVNFGVQVVNNNKADLQLVDMEVDFPAGTTDPANPSQELTTLHELIGDLSAGATAQKSVQAIIFGEENTQKEINVILTYKIKGSDSLFTKQKSYDVLINSSPAVLTITSFKEITSGQEFDITAEVRSNSQQVLKGVLLKAEYPFGFTFLSSDLKPLSGNDTWRIGDLPPGGGRTVTIHGKLEGADTDLRTFNFSTGAQSSASSGTIGTEYMAASQDISIQKPFVSLALSVDGDTATTDHVGTFNQPSRIQLNWFNNLPSSISNMSISVKLSGSAYDKTLVQPDMGYFRSATDEIIWNQQTNPEFGTVAAGASGSVTFTVTPSISSSGSNAVVNPTVTLAASVSADRTQESNVPGSLTSTITRGIRVSSNISLTGTIVRAAGPFASAGPVPPKVDTKTTYTVVWTIDNTSSAVHGAQVTATLPPYITWLGAVSPSSENVAYDKDTGTVTWAVGSVPAYARNTQRREVSFQISLEPSITQVDTAPTLINQATLSATDDFTGASLSSSQDFLTTSYSTDPSFKSGDETVVK